MENSPLNLPTILQPTHWYANHKLMLAGKSFGSSKPLRIKRITSSAASLIPKRYNSVNFCLCVWARVLFGLGFEFFHHICWVKNSNLLFNWKSICLVITSYIIFSFQFNCSWNFFMVVGNLLWCFGLLCLNGWPLVCRH